MKETSSDTDDIAKFPCVRNCCLNEADICLGCFRSLDEIMQWSGADNRERHIILQNARQRKAENEKHVRTGNSF